jgi:hypothetical protein
MSADQKQYYKDWCNKNREKVRENGRRFRRLNPEKSRGYSKKWRKANWKKQLALQYAWRVKNREKYLLEKRNYRLRHPEKGRVQCRKRKALKLGCACGESILIADWEKKWRRKKRVICYWCLQKFSPKQCHSDHITPLSKRGGDCLANLCISCAHCNLTKHGKSVENWNRKLSQPVLAGLQYAPPTHRP